ncbi:MAG: ribokinase [Acidobacteriaceae bacterium]|nr:ribokinase [Acidobacteriaceae bacterium]
MKKILVLGSLNIDLVQRVPRLPQPGETLPAGELHLFPGGKGANQACAAALLGGDARMAGCVGNDAFAETLLGALRQSGVNTTLVRQADTSTGTAVIFVLPNGENVIVIASAANGAVSTAAAIEAVDVLEAGDFLLCQLEIPLDTVQTALRAAHERHVVTILDPAPACTLPDNLLSFVSILTPNQLEAGFLAGSSTPRDSAEAAACAQTLRRRGAATVIVKMGEQGCLIADESGTAETPGLRVEVRDTTAAGDTFNGALAVAMAEGAALRKAARFANGAAALSVTKPGAISSIPTRDAVDRFLA